MNAPLSRSEAEALLPAFVLGALEPEEMLSLAAYLETAPNLAALVSELEEAALQLAYVAPEASLPPSAKDSLLAKARADLPTHATEAVKPRVAPPVEQPVTWLDRVREWLAGLDRRGLAFGAIVGLLLIVVYQQVQLSRERRVLDIISNADQVVVLPGTEFGTQVAPGAMGVFYQRGDQGVWLFEGLPPLPADQTYQLWLVVGGMPTPVDLLSNAELDEPKVVEVSPAMQNYTIADLSIERAGGSDIITKEQVVLRGTVE